MKKWIIALCFLSTSTWAGDGFCPSSKHFGNTVEEKVLEGLQEVRKTESYEKELDLESVVKVHNKYGDIKLVHWNKQKVHMAIEIVANASTEKEAIDFMSGLSLDKSDGLKVNMDCQAIKTVKANNEKTFLRVNILVSVPPSANLEIENARGEVFIPEHVGTIQLQQKYGTLFSKALSNPNNRLDLNYGKAYLTSIENANIKTYKTEVVCDALVNSSLVNEFGTVKIKEASNIQFNGKYTQGYISHLRKKCSVKLEYSENFSLGTVSQQIEELELITSYSSVDLPICRKSKFDMMVECKNSSLDVSYKEMAAALNTKSRKNLQEKITLGSNATDPSKIIILAENGRVNIK